MNKKKTNNVVTHSDSRIVARFFVPSRLRLNTSSFEKYLDSFMHGIMMRISLIDNGREMIFIAYFPSMTTRDRNWFCLLLKKYVLRDCGETDHGYVVQSVVRSTGEWDRAYECGGNENAFMELKHEKID